MIPSDALERFAQARVGHLATVREDGRPHLVPFVFVLHGDSLYAVIDAKRKKRENVVRVENIKANPNVSVLVDHYEEDWNRLWWIRADGLARVVDDGEDRDRVIEFLAEKYPQYRREAPTGPAIVVNVQRWGSWEA